MLAIRAYRTWGHPLSLLVMQIALMPIGLASTQVLLISRSTCSAKLLVILKAAAVIVIVQSAAEVGIRLEHATKFSNGGV